MVSDPYLALHLPHTATNEQIKRSYHELARRHHPDRFVTASDAEKDAATQRFAKIAQAYELLSDARRKAQYDHIYKYGGYDDDEQEEKKTDGAEYIPRPVHSAEPQTQEYWNWIYMRRPARLSVYKRSGSIQDFSLRHSNSIEITHGTAQLWPGIRL